MSTSSPNYMIKRFISSMKHVIQSLHLNYT